MAETPRGTPWSEVVRLSSQAAVACSRSGAWACRLSLSESDGALQEAGRERPGQIGVVGLKARVVRVAKPVIGVGEEVPLHELAVGDEALPERALDGRRGDEVQAGAEDQRGALERPGQLESVSGSVRGLGLVADGRVVQH